MRREWVTIDSDERRKVPLAPAFVKSDTTLLELVEVSSRCHNRSSPWQFEFDPPKIANARNDRIMFRAFLTRSLIC
jgi:hypothetical protein